MRVVAKDLGEHGMPRLEAFPAVPAAEQIGRLLQRPLRARPPGLEVDLTGGRSPLDSERRRALGGAGAAPVPAVRVDPVGRVAAAVALLVQQGAHRARPGGTPDAGPAGGGHAVRVGGRPT